jgi:hypothetical protein
LIHRHQVSQSGAVLIAHPCSAVHPDTDAEVPDSNIEVGIANNIGDGGRYGGLNLD